MPEVHSVEEVKKDILDMLVFKGNVIDKSLKGDYLDDYAKIGAYLTDELACTSHLSRLNSLLVPVAKQEKMQKTVFGFDQNKMKTEKFVSPHDPDSKGEIVKHHKILTSFFANWEDLNGFNKGGNHEGVALPPRAAELVDFVAADDFRKYLLKHGYHWKDAAVGASHGEFTHRLHWYIIVEENHRRDDKWLSNKPIDLFKELAETWTFNPKMPDPFGPKNSIWDKIVDNSGSVEKSTRSNGFRCPENLHKFLKSKSSRDRDDLWVLASLIWGRAEKRRIVGKDNVTSDLQKEIVANGSNLVVKGTTVSTKGTMVWQK